MTHDNSFVASPDFHLPSSPTNKSSATKCFDAQTGADQEVQRILLELLNQMDSFDQGSNVKVCLHIFIDSGINILLGYLGY